MRRPSKDSIEDNTLLTIPGPWAQTRLDGELVQLLHRLFEPVDVFFGPDGSEIIAVNADDYLSLDVGRDTTTRSLG